MTFWTADKEDALSRLWQQGHSGSEIGSAIGCSRNAAIGKASRMGLPARRWGLARVEAKPPVLEKPIKFKRSCEFFLPDGEMCSDDVYKRSFCEKHYKICYVQGTSREEGDRQA